MSFDVRDVSNLLLSLGRQTCPFLHAGWDPTAYAMCPVPEEDTAFDFTWDQAFSFSAFNSPGADNLPGRSPHEAPLAVSSNQTLPTPALPPQPRTKSDFLPQSQWRSDVVFVSDPPEYLHYKTEVKITLNNRAKYTHRSEHSSHPICVLAFVPTA